METVDQISQVALFGLTVLAMILVARKNKWGFVLGLCAQPFWLFTSYYNEQWGIFLNTLVFTGIWIYGIYQWFWAVDSVDKDGQIR